jgi:hypothetical protein
MAAAAAADAEIERAAGDEPELPLPPLLWLPPLLPGLVLGSEPPLELLLPGLLLLLLLLLAGLPLLLLLLGLLLLELLLESLLPLEFLLPVGKTLPPERGLLLESLLPLPLPGELPATTT